MTLQEEFALVRAHLLRSRVGFFETAAYPTQMAAPPASDTHYGQANAVYLGELRGFYPYYPDDKTDAESVQHGYFQPWNSAYHTEAVNQPGADLRRAHNGVDVYAPFFPFPFEVPVVAMTRGRLFSRTLWEHTSTAGYETERVGNQQVQTRRRRLEALGNRIRLVFEVEVGKASREYFVDYGHLSRFDGSDRGERDQPEQRIVEPGDLLGFVGKSGNADFKTGNSTRDSLWHLNAGHIHVGVWRLGTRIDPRDVLPKPLAFDPRDTPEVSDLGYATNSLERRSRPERGQWGQAQPAPRDAMPQQEVPQAVLVNHDLSPPLRRVVKQGKKTVRRRALYPAPFHWLDVDSTAILRRTQDAYEFASSRLTRATGSDAVAVSHFDDAVRRFKEILSRDTVHNDVLYWGDTAGALLNRLREVLNAVTPGQPGQGAAVARALLHFKEVLWILMAGPAIAALNRTGPQVECGVGVGGHLFATAWPRAVAAVHLSTPTVAAGSAVSVTFGAGGLRHATVGYLAHAAAPEGPVREAVGQLIGAALATQAVFHRAFQINERLSRGESGSFDEFWAHQPDVGPIAEPKPANELYARMYALAGTIGAMAAATDRTNIHAFMAALIATNVTIFAEAVAVSNRTEGKVAIAPALMGLSLDRVTA